MPEGNGKDMLIEGCGKGSDPILVEGKDILSRNVD